MDMTARTNHDKDEIQFEQEVRSGLDMINSAIHNRISQVESELVHWKSLAKAHESNVHSLSLELKRVQAKLQQSESSAKSLLAENTQIRASKHSLSQKYLAMKKLAGQLESWRRTIIKMVEYTPTDHTSSRHTLDTKPPMRSDQSSDDETTRQLINKKRHQSSFVANIESNASLMIGLNASSVPSLNLSHSLHSISTDLPLTQDTTAHRVPESKASTDHPSSSDHHQVPDQNAMNESISSTIADAQALYRSIRTLVTPAAFKQFASTINAFNACTIGVNETVQRIDAIVTDPFLASQMRHLIYRAVQESSSIVNSKVSANQSDLKHIRSSVTGEQTTRASAGV